MASRSSRAPPFSIFEVLLGRQAQVSPGATSLLRQLLKVAANVAVDSDSNALTSYSIVKQARESCDRIDASIQSVTAESDDDRAFQIYQKYVDDIRELERLLLDPDTLLAQPEVVLDVKTISECLANIPIWEQNRAGLHKQLQMLQLLRGEQSTSAPSWEQRRDDAAMLHIMISKINAVELSQRSPEMNQAIEHLKAFLPKLDQPASAQFDSPKNPSSSTSQSVVSRGTSSPHPDQAAGSTIEGVLYAIKMAWLIYAALTEKEGKGTSQRRKYHLETPTVWKGARSLCERVNSGRVDGLKTAFEEFIRSVEVNGDPPVNQRYVHLIRASSNVTRPFIYRNRTLIAYARDLIILYNDASNSSARIRNLGIVSNALDAVKRAADAAAANGAHPDDQGWEVVPTTLTAVENAFEDAKRLLKVGLKAYSADSKATKLDTDMATAIEEDENRLASLKEKCSGKTGNPQAVGAVSVALVRRVVGGMTRPEVQEMRGDTKISAILWLDRNDSPNSGFTSVRAHSLNNPPLDLGRTVQELAQNGKVTLIIS